MNDYNYPSAICEYCWYTDYGHSSCEFVPPNSHCYSTCEGVGCKEAYEDYVAETGDETPLEELF